MRTTFPPKSAALSVLLVSLSLAGCGNPAPTAAETLPNRMVKRNTLVSDLDSPVTGSPRGVTRLQSPFRLSTTALFLGRMNQKPYLEIQDKWVGSTIPACNFFLITALCESGYCEIEKPFFLAAEFDLYFIQQGWRKVSLQELKKLFQTQASFDAVFQKAGPSKGRSGHVMIPTGYDLDSDQMMIAQGDLNVSTNEVQKVGDDFLLNWDGGFTIFVNDNPEPAFQRGAHKFPEASGAPHESQAPESHRP